MANGIKFALPGNDVATAADYDLYFSSGWPWLKIHKTGVVTFSATASLNEVTHKLGYPALVFATVDRLGFYPRCVRSSTTKISFTGLNVGDKIRYYIFTLPLNKTFNSETFKPHGVPYGSSNYKYGLRFSPNGIESKDDRYVPIDSAFRSPLVHKVQYALTAPIVGGTYNGNNGLEYLLDLPYTPLYFVWFSNDGIEYRLLDTTAQATPKVNYDGLDELKIRGIVLNNGQNAAGYGSIVVLKDPYDMAPLREATV